MTAKVTPAGQVLFWGAATATSGQFLYPGSLNNAASAAGESGTRIIAARAGIVRNLRVLCGADTTVTVRVGLADSALTVNATANTPAADTTHEVAVTAGGYISCGVSGTAGNAVFASCEFV